jgi:hypothetical protein
LAVAALPNQAQAKGKAGTVTLTAEQWQEIQAKLQELDRRRNDGQLDRRCRRQGQ